MKKPNPIDLGELQQTAEMAIKRFNAAQRAFQQAGIKLVTAEDDHRAAQAALRGGFATVAQSTKAPI